MSPVNLATRPPIRLSPAKAVPAGNKYAVSSPQMVVPINGLNYRVVVVPGPLLVRGETAASRVRHDDRTIEVDDIIPASDRWRVAALAVAYACHQAGREKFMPVRVLGIVD